MDQPFFYGSQTCGMCIAMHGTGPGSGLDPVPLTTQYVLVSNLCPECLAGSLDQEINGDGRWTIEWYPVQCAVGTTPLVYSFQGSNAYYIKMQISNHRVPVQGVQWFFSGTWYDMSRSGDNYFIIQAINSQPLILPAQIKVTSIFGDVVIDTVATSSPNGRVIGNVQFPESTMYETVPDPNAAPATPAPDTATPTPPVGTPAPAISPTPDTTTPVPPTTSMPLSPAPVPPTPDTTTPVPPSTPTPSAPAPVPPTPDTTTPVPATTPTPSAPTPVPPTPDTTTPVPATTPTPSAPAPVPPTPDTTTPVPPTTPTPSAPVSVAPTPDITTPSMPPTTPSPAPYAPPPMDTGTPIPATPYVPAPASTPAPPASTTAPPTTSIPPGPSTDLTPPTYINGTGTNTTSAPPSTSMAPPSSYVPATVPGSASDGSSSWNAANQASMHLTPTQIAQLMPGYVQAPSKDGKTIIPAYGQCGGLNNAPSQADAGDHPWNSTECSDQFQCLSNSNPWYWQCVPVPVGLNTTTLAKHLPLTTALAVALNKNTTCTRFIPSYGQCGGSAGSCYGADCLDAVWSKACCAPNNKGEATTCVRQSAMKWMCQLESLVASNAYSKTVRKGAYGASLGSVTALAKLQGDQAQSYKIALASSLAAAQSQPPTTDMSVANLQSFANAVPHGSNGVVLQQATVGGEQIRAGNGPAPPPSNASIISGEHIDTSNMKGVPVDPTTTSIAGIEASTPIANFTLGQATRYIIAGISAESAGTNCTIWVDEGIQCGGQGGACHADSCVDASWDGACCLHPLNRCQRFDENFWECRTGSTFVSAE
ncbi:hypothetical protein CVIRNUC_002914 [Coccomyxa viridis]|uniref:Uncharacterized protein n=1 Tax=Coccomyxa viridis TaxID=1274662 RepID=A0AAV1HY56_9CHLO|nr:hypothetical protein CVIRNUC_002914 [Coccomyxa viridis]